MEKILSFIVNTKNEKLLLLHGNDTDPQFHKSFWYVVTGAVEPEDNSLIDTVRREIKEETNLDIKKVIDLDWFFEYESLGQHCIEHVFISYVENDSIILNEENYEYKWCLYNEFIKNIKWFYDKSELTKRIRKYINI